MPNPNVRPAPQGPHIPSLIPSACLIHHFSIYTTTHTHTPNGFNPSGASPANPYTFAPTLSWLLPPRSPSEPGSAPHTPSHQLRPARSCSHQAHRELLISEPRYHSAIKQGIVGSITKHCKTNVGLAKGDLGVDSGTSIQLFIIWWLQNASTPIY